RRLVITRPASSRTRRCFITPKRDIGIRRSSAVSVWPSALNSSSSKLRRVGSAGGFNTSSICSRGIRDPLVTCQTERMGCASMRLGLALLVAVTAAALAPGARAAQPCDAKAADAVAHSALLPYAQAHAPKVYKGAIAKLHYERGALLCRDLTGDGRAEMVV